MTDEELISRFEEAKSLRGEDYLRLIALARRGAAVQWRPIKQAPRDNWGAVPQVLARDADGNVFLAFYYPPPHGDNYCKSSVDPTPAVEFIPLTALDQKP